MPTFNVQAIIQVDAADPRAAAQLVTATWTDKVEIVTVIDTRLTAAPSAPPSVVPASVGKKRSPGVFPG